MISRTNVNNALSLGVGMFNKFCRFCSKPAVLRIRYSGLLVCKRHFMEYLEKRVFRTIQKYNMIRERDNVLLGLSGGKDSVVLLHMFVDLQKVLKFEIFPLFIDLGIHLDDYSQVSGEIVKRNCKKLGLDVIIVKMQDEYGFSIDDVFAKKLRRPICSVCGLIKRYVLNRKALELSVNKVATGHNLNDEASFLLQNIINANIDLLSKFGPIQPALEGLFVSRIKPFFETYEDEISLYATFKKLEYIDKTCPYAKDASTLKLKRIITNFEEIRPGAALTMVKSFYKKIKPLLEGIREEEKINKCEICGMPTSMEVCSFCRLKEKMTTKTNYL